METDKRYDDQGRLCYVKVSLGAPATKPNRYIRQLAPLVIVDHSCSAEITADAIDYEYDQQGRLQSARIRSRLHAPPPTGRYIREIAPCVVVIHKGEPPISVDRWIS